MFLLSFTGSVVYADSPPRFSVWVEEQVSEGFAAGGESFDFTRRRGGVGVRGEAVDWGWRHDYRAFGLPGEAATNGHVHSTGPYAVWDSGSWHLAVHPALAVSSNVLKEQRDLGWDDVTPGFTLLRLHPGPAGGTWQWGLRADSRTGRFRPLPMAAWRSQGEGGVDATLGFPDSTLQWHFHPGWTIGAGAGPDGGAWRVRDRDFERVSTLRQRRWRGALFLAWSATRNLCLGAAWEHAFRRNWTYTRDDGTQRQIDPPDGSVFLFSLRLGF